MVLTHNEIEKRGYKLNPQNNLAAIDLQRFHSNEDERSLKLSLELLAKMKVYQKINTFLDKVGSKEFMDSAPLHPVLKFLMGDSAGFKLGQDEIECFFQLEKQYFQFEGHLDNLIHQDIWNFSHDISAAVFGFPLSYLNFLEYADDRDITLKYESFVSVCHFFLDGHIAFSEFQLQAKATLAELETLCNQKEGGS